MIRLEDVNEGNWRIPLTVSEAQKEHVAGSTAILARAYAYRNSRSKAYIVFNDDIPVGMGLYHDDSDAAKNLYEKFGFVETDRDEDEIIMELNF